MFIGQAGSNQAALEIQGYLNPGSQNNYYEANWLMIELAVNTPQIQWSNTAPAMLTEEVSRFIGWLQTIADHQPTSFYFDCEEDLLYFSLLEVNADTFQLVLHLQLDFKPPQTTGHSFQLPITLAREALLQWIAYLKAEIAKYPAIYPVKEP